MISFSILHRFCLTLLQRIEINPIIIFGSELKFFNLFFESVKLVLFILDSQRFDIRLGISKVDFTTKFFKIMINSILFNRSIVLLIKLVELLIPNTVLFEHTLWTLSSCNLSRCVMKLPLMC